MKYIGLLVLALIVLAGCVTEVTVDEDVQLPLEPSSPGGNAGGTILAGTTNQEACESAQGTWIESAHECEGISAEYCQEIGGQFNECASACRNNPDAVICTLQCVLVCEFDTTESEIISMSVGHTKKDCVGVSQQQCLIVNNEYFYDNIEGFVHKEGYSYELLVKRTERENVPADASKYMYTLVEIVSKEEVGVLLAITCPEKYNTTEPIACTREYMPVCGNDGQTYGNACEACASSSVDSYVPTAC